MSALTARSEIWGYSEASGTPGAIAHGRSITYSPLGEYVGAEAWMRLNGGSGQYVSAQDWGMATADAFITLPPTGGGNVEVSGYHSRYYCCDGSGWIYEDQSYAYWGYNDPNGGGGGGGGGSECIPLINGIVPSSGPGNGYTEIWGSGFNTVTSAYLAGASYVSMIPVDDNQLNISFGGVSPGQHSLTVANECGGSNAAVYTVQPDPTPTVNSVEPSSWQAGQNYDVIISGQGFGTNPSVSLPPNTQGVNYWVQAANDIQINLRVEVHPSAPTQPFLDLTVTSTGYWGNGFQGQGNSPTSLQQTVQVQGGTGVSVSQSPEYITMSTGDSNKSITTSVTPSSAQFSVTYTKGLAGGLAGQPPGSPCTPTLSVPDSNGTGSSTSMIAASPTNCGGVFNVLAIANSVPSSNGTVVVVPPQALIRQMYGAARDYSDNPGLDPGQVAQRSVGVAAKNRFGLPEFFGFTTWQQFQNQGTIENSGISNGPPVLLDNAVAVYTGQVSGGFVGGATCYWSPRYATQFIPIRDQYLSNPAATTLPAGNLGLPGCYPPENRQVVWKTSMPNNVNPGENGAFLNAPAFLFVRQRSTNQPAIVQIP